MVRVHCPSTQKDIQEQTLNIVGKGSVVESDSGSGDGSESGSGIESASGSGVESASGSTSGDIDGMFHVAIKFGNGGIDIIALYA